MVRRHLSPSSVMILNCMLATAYGGTEKVFLDQLQMLQGAGLPVLGVARPGSPAAARAHAAGLPCENLSVLTEWDPLTRWSARKLVEKYRPNLILLHGLKAHRIMGRAV